MIVYDRYLLTRLQGFEAITFTSHDALDGGPAARARMIQFFSVCLPQLAGLLADCQVDLGIEVLQGVTNPCCPSLGCVQMP